MQTPKALDIKGALQNGDEVPTNTHTHTNNSDYTSNPCLHADWRSYPICNIRIKQPKQTTSTAAIYWGRVELIDW